MCKIILVDDERLTRDAIAATVPWEEHGFQLTGTACNGREAMKLVEQNTPDLVLTDICMPVMDGLELSAWLYEYYPSIRIVIFSGYQDFEYARRSIGYGVVNYLVKPVTCTELVEELQKVKVKIETADQGQQKSETVQARDSVSEKDALAVQAIDYLDKNYMNGDITLQTMCEQLCVCSSYFSLIFKKATGETFVEYLTRIRIEKAKELLEYSDMKNYEIAEQAGYQDPHYFGTIFKKWTGMTPREYSRRLQGKKSGYRQIV